MRPWRAQLLECAQAVRSRAAFARTLDSVRKRMLGCTRDADLAGGVSAARLNQAPRTSRGAQLWHLYVAQQVFATRAYSAEDSAPMAAYPSTRSEHPRLLRESASAQGRQMHIETTAVFHVFERTPTPSHGRHGNPSDSDLRAFARRLYMTSDLGATCCNQRLNDVLVLGSEAMPILRTCFWHSPCAKLLQPMAK